MSTAARRLNDLRKKAGMTLESLSAASGVLPHRLIAVLYRPQTAREGEVPKVAKAIEQRLNGSSRPSMLPDYCHVLEAVRRVVGMTMVEVCDGQGRSGLHAAARLLVGEVLRRNRHLSGRRMARLMGVTAGAFRRRNGDGGWVEEAVGEVERVLEGLVCKERDEEESTQVAERGPRWNCH